MGRIDIFVFDLESVHFRSILVTIREVTAFLQKHLYAANNKTDQISLTFEKKTKVEKYRWHWIRTRRNEIETYWA